MSRSEPLYDESPDRIYGIGKRTLLRIGLAVLTVALVAFWFRVPLAGVWGLLWPPGELSGRWFTLLMTVLLSFLVPVAIVVRLADILYDRYVAPADDS